MKHFVKAEGIVKRFGKTKALDGTTFSIDAPGITVVLGPNGAGKSTLFSCILGLQRPNAGSLSVLGLDPIEDHRAVCERVAFVPDHPDAPDWMTARELFAFLAPQYPTWNEAAIDGMVERFGLPLDTPFKGMSRGQGAKAMLAAAFAPSPELILLDEPFSGLDPVVRHELLRAFLAEFEGRERAALVATHDLDVAARIADRVIVCADGRIVSMGTVEEVLGEYTPARIPEKLYAILEKVA